MVECISYIYSCLKFLGERSRSICRCKGFDPIANRYLNATSSRCHEINEKVKKPNCNNRILQIEHRTFTPLVFSIYGSMGRECTKFYSKLAELLSDKRKESKSLTVNWLRTKVCFGLLNSCLLCLTIT